MTARARKHRRKTRDSEITEEVVEGIYIEGQYKIENVPGYAEPFKRVTDHLRKCMDSDDYKPSEQEQEEFGRALAELMWIEMCYRFTKGEYP